MMEPCAVQSLDLLREVEDTSILRTGYLAPRKLGMHRNNQDNDGLQLVFGPLAGFNCWRGWNTAGTFHRRTPRAI